MTENIPDIMHYESAIWAIADELRGASIKQSDFPAHMMPFFALMMLEGRMRNAVRDLKTEYGITDDEVLGDDFEELFKSKGVGFNRFIVMEKKCLADICRNDSTFENDFRSYLGAFDADLKRLLGIERGHDEEKFLNMGGIVAGLRAKGILLKVAAKWAEIDLSPYDNSAITTLEEHIKRKWADISAATAGEQYTPDDIISLMAAITADKIQKPKNKIIHLYDPTCGGANLLFGVADRLQETGYQNIATYGSEYNDALYALAAIESRFRDLSQIEYGNTLTKVPFAGKQFDAINANPPYGSKWTGFESDIRNDQRGQFEGGLPSTSDGQMLFMQHILWQLDSKGVAVVVADGSTLFSGDAGGGESNIRKYIFDHDWVEAIIQMPQQEFFNTGITTYLWIFNKDKSPDRRNLVALIDASKLWTPLKKSKGDKRREINEEQRGQIVKALHDFVPSDICRIFDREHFYYNKQKVLLTELDPLGKAVEQECVNPAKEIKIGEKLYDYTFCMAPDEARTTLAELKAANWKEDGIEVRSYDGSVYECGGYGESVFKDNKPVGRGEFTFALANGETRGTKAIKVLIAPEITTDYEIIPHHFDENDNNSEIESFVKKYIFKPCRLSENKVGVEINFNKEFYVPEKLDSVENILEEIRSLDEQLAEVNL